MKPLFFSLKRRADERVVVAEVVVATGFVQRARGLLGKTSLPADRGLLIHTSSIHTCFMKFALDIVYINAEGRVLALRKNLKPWRFSAVPGSNRVVECAAGELPEWLVVGDVLFLDQHKPVQ